jgi:hypothetical protein
MRRSAILVGLLFLAACAGRSPQPVPMMQAYDNNLSCEQIQAEIQTNESKARQLIDEDNSNRNANIARLARSAFFCSGRRCSLLISPMPNESKRMHYTSAIRTLRACISIAPV